MAIRKCPHGVYWPAGDEKAFSCQQCNPDGTGTGTAPVLPRSSGDPLFATRPAAQETCGTCGCIRTYCLPACRVCGTPFTASDSRGREQDTANLHTPGACPNCSSTVHYEKTARKWECADCGTVFTAPKRNQREAEI